MNQNDTILVLFFGVILVNMPITNTAYILTKTKLKLPSFLAQFQTHFPNKFGSEKGGIYF